MGLAFRFGVSPSVPTPCAVAILSPELFQGSLFASGSLLSQVRRNVRSALAVRSIRAEALTRFDDLLLVSARDASAVVPVLAQIPGILHAGVGRVGVLSAAPELSNWVQELVHDHVPEGASLWLDCRADDGSLSDAELSAWLAQRVRARNPNRKIVFREGDQALVVRTKSSHALVFLPLLKGPGGFPVGSKGPAALWLLHSPADEKLALHLLSLGHSVHAFSSDATVGFSYDSVVHAHHGSPVVVKPVSDLSGFLARRRMNRVYCSLSRIDAQTVFSVRAQVAKSGGIAVFPFLGLR